MAAVEPIIDPLLTIAAPPWNVTPEPTTMPAAPLIVPALLILPEKVETAWTKIPFRFDEIVPPLPIPPVNVELPTTLMPAFAPEIVPMLRTPLRKVGPGMAT